MQASILLVSDDEGLSRTRILMLGDWRTTAVTSAGASDAIAAYAYDLLILCQTIPDDVAASLAAQMLSVHSASKVMTINTKGHLRRFGTVQYTLEMEKPTWLPNAVARTLSADNL
jgi:hypothetical protein